jgi:glycine/D-amino acid oxidase-like deaminating enzyme
MKSNIIQMARITIIGGGVAGCISAIELAKLGYAVVLLEQAPDILLGTSARTPGRMGLGYHYFDSKTAQKYTRHTIDFMRKYNDCFLGGEDTPHLQDGRYFVVKDSLVSAQDIMASYSEISACYEKMCDLDSGNKIFPTTHLHRVLKTDEFSSDVAMDKVAFAVETKENLLDWKKFDARLRKEIASYPNITIKTGFEAR